MDSKTCDRRTGPRSGVVYEHVPPLIMSPNLSNGGGVGVFGRLGFAYRPTDGGRTGDPGKN